MHRRPRQSSSRQRRCRRSRKFQNPPRRDRANESFRLWRTQLRCSLPAGLAKSTMPRAKAACFQLLMKARKAISFVLDTPHWFVSDADNLPIEGTHSGCDLRCGAGAVPAGGLANRTRAASGPRSSGTMTGPRGARCTGAGEGPPVCTRRFQETRPGAESGVTAWREPRWSAERRARPAGRAAAPEARLGGNI
jgi:hypothetical protein